MTLPVGTRLGPYEITAPIGAGGMGEVYRAHDAKLGRDVAVKVLPEAVAGNADALARFEREARSVAALSHPGILAIYDFGHENGTAYAVMELLEGATLREKLVDGPLTQRKALELAGQIARALAAAHEKEIVHRDLKPENLFVMKDGRAKVLDFGLARAMASPSGSDTNSPTVAAATEPGTVLGTVGYMSPEQVKGRAADARSDIFSFGCVLYEMLTGRRAFQKETAAETMTAILREDPREFPESGAHVSPGLERVVRHCLEKEPDDRFRSAHDLAFALEAVSGTSTSRVDGVTDVGRSAGKRLALVPVAAIALVAALIGAGIARLASPRIESTMTAVRPLSYSGKDGEPAMSPDRKTLAFSSERDGKVRIWLRQLATGDEVGLTSGKDFTPRFAPDGAQLLFLRRDEVAKRTDVYRVAVVGGEPRRIVSDAEGGADWSPDGRTVVLARIKLENRALISSLYVVAPEGGEPKELARFEKRAVFSPRFSPDGRRIVAISTPDIGNVGGRFEVIDVPTGSSRSLEPPRSLGVHSNAVFTDDGRDILYIQSLSVRFSGGSRLVRQEIRSGKWKQLLWVPFVTTALDTFDAGQLVADTTSQRQNLYEVPLGEEHAVRRWLTRGISADRQPVFSPDGEWVTFSSNRGGNLDIWSLSRKTAALRHLTEDAADDWDPGYTRDGKLLFSSSRGGHLEIWTAETDGSSPRRVSDDGADAENGTSTPDGWIVYWSGNSQKTGLWKIRMDGAQATRLTEGVTNIPEVSPDGRFVAFIKGLGTERAVSVARVSDGTLLPFEIQLASPRFDNVAGRSRWSPDGKKIYFVGLDEKGLNGIFVQDFDPEAKDTSATRRKVAGFDPEITTESFAVSPDGKSLVIAGLEELYGLVTIEGVPGAGRRRP